MSFVFGIIFIFVLYIIIHNNVCSHDVNDNIKFDRMSYNCYVEYLKNVYGEVPGNYFLDNKCEKKNNDIKRYRDDGLYIHHIKENKGCWLSKKVFAAKYPYEYQLSKNLVYCNLLEHFILHLKIYMSTNMKFGGYGYYKIGKDLYDFYNYGVIDKTFSKAVCDAIYDKKEMFDYFYNKYYQIYSALSKYYERNVDIIV